MTSPTGAGFERNSDAMIARIDGMRRLEKRTAALSGTRHDRFAERGQITPPERLARLLDPDMQWLRLHDLAGHLVDRDDPETSVAGGMFLAGIGYVSGVRAMIVVNDSGINAGAIGPMAFKAQISFGACAL